MRNKTRYEHQIDRAVARDLIGDVNVAALGVPGFWFHDLSGRLGLQEFCDGQTVLRRVLDEPGMRPLSIERLAFGIRAASRSDRYSGVS